MCHKTTLIYNALVFVTMLCVILLFGKREFIKSVTFRYVFFFFLPLILSLFLHDSLKLLYVRRASCLF